MKENIPCDKDFFFCALPTLALSTFIAIAAIVAFLDYGISADTIESAMIILSIPWFAFWYFLCRIAHRTEIVFTNDNKKT